MGHNKPGKGDDFLEGRIADENLESAQLLSAHHPGHPQPCTVTAQTIGVLPTCAGHVCQSVDVGCCWIIIATTKCTTTTPSGATCCWRFLATTDCTDTRDGAACCWQFLGTTDCTSTGCSEES